MRWSASGSRIAWLVMGHRFPCLRGPDGSRIADGRASGHRLIPVIHGLALDRLRVAEAQADVVGHVRGQRGDVFGSNAATIASAVGRTDEVHWACCTGGSRVVLSVGWAALRRAGTCRASSVHGVTALAAGWLVFAD